MRSSSYDNNTNIVHFVLSNLADFRDAVLDLCYDVSIADDPAWNAEKEPDSLTYRNTVEWDGETDSTETQVSNHKATLEKTGELLENTDTLRYEIVVNPEVRDLVPNADTITLSDQITTPTGTSVALKAETVKVYAYNAEAQDSHGAPLPDDDWKFSYDAPTMTFTLPDETACVVVYEYTINRGRLPWTLPSTTRLPLRGKRRSPRATILKSRCRTPARAQTRRSSRSTKWIKRITRRSFPARISVWSGTRRTKLAISIVGRSAR